MNLPGFRDLHPTTRRLLLARGLRSIGQGALVVDLALYLDALQWTAVAIGLVLSVSGLFGSALSLLVGTTSDRLRRKPFLLSYEVITVAAGTVAVFAAQPFLLGAAIVIAGFGRGAGGAAGPFSPAEQAWLAEDLAPGRRGWIYSLNAAMGFFGMGLGALIASLPVLWRPILPGPAAYRPLFALVGLVAVAGFAVIRGAAETYHRPVAATDLQARQREVTIRHQENLILGKLVLVNSFNGLAIGLTGPLMSYWFALRFHVGPEAIGPVMGVTFFVSGLLALFTGRLADRIGIVSSVVRERLVAVILQAILPLMPVYGFAALVYLLRSAFSRGTSGARQALAVGLVRDERRGLATSLSSVSAQVPRSIGPTIAGYLLSVGQFALPFYAAAVLQGVYLLLYSLVFRSYEPDGTGADHQAHGESE